MTIEHYQNLIIGSGEAGKNLAWNLSRMGQKTAMVERSMIGGSCPNIALRDAIITHRTVSEGLVVLFTSDIASSRQTVSRV